MAIFRLPLWLNKKISFWKLLGCGKNGSFDIHPDWNQWGIICVLKNKPGFLIEEKSIIQNVYGKFIENWWQTFNCRIYTVILEPIEGHGKWDNKEVFGNLPMQSAHKGMVAVLTRATIRITKLKSFWKNVEHVSAKMKDAEGFITSVGIGEIPWIKQATFSIWKNKECMKNFAYKLSEHKEIIRKTRMENWYKEDMFIRFRLCYSFGTLNGKCIFNNTEANDPQPD